jgi:hypothetical protein
MVIRQRTEFDFRYNARDVSDVERRHFCIKQVAGKRLMYRNSMRNKNGYVLKAGTENHGLLRIVDLKIPVPNGANNAGRTHPGWSGVYHG